MNIKWNSEFEKRKKKRKTREILFLFDLKRCGRKRTCQLMIGKERGKESCKTMGRGNGREREGRNQTKMEEREESVLFSTTKRFCYCFSLFMGVGWSCRDLIALFVCVLCHVFVSNGLGVMGKNGIVF